MNDAPRVGRDETKDLGSTPTPFVRAASHEPQGVRVVQERRSLRRLDQAHRTVDRRPEHPAGIALWVQENHQYLHPTGIDRVEAVRRREHARSTRPATVMRCAHADITVDGQYEVHGMMRVQRTSRTRTPRGQYGRPCLRVDPPGNRRQAHTRSFSRLNSHRANTASSFKTTLLIGRYDVATSCKWSAWGRGDFGSLLDSSLVPTRRQKHR